MIAQHQSVGALMQYDVLEQRHSRAHKEDMNEMRTQRAPKDHAQTACSEAKPDTSDNVYAAHSSTLGQ